MSLESEAKEMWEKQMKKGTPKSLEEAARNAIEALREKSSDNPEEVITAHMRDYLSQKFQLFMNGSSDAVDTCATAIWEKIIGIK